MDLRDNPFMMFCTSPNLYFWKNDNNWRQKIIEPFFQETKMVKEINSRIKKIVEDNYNKKHMGIIASYGMGKSTGIILALDYIFKNFKDKIKPIYIFLHNTPSYNNADKIINEIIFQILITFNISNEVIECLNFNDEIFYEFLKINIADKKIILLIDEFDVVQTNRNIGQIEIKKILKFIYDLGSNVDNLYIFLFTIGNVENIFETYKEFKESYYFINIERLEKEEIENMYLYIKSTYNIKFTEEAITKIISSFNGNPRLISKINRACYEELIQTETDEVNQNLLEIALTKFFDVKKIGQNIEIDDEKIYLSKFKLDLIYIIVTKLKGEAKSHEVLDEIKTFRKDVDEEEFNIYKITNNLNQMRYVNLVIYDQEEKKYKIGEELIKLLYKM